MCARALLVLLVVCVCALFFNAGRSSEKSSQRVLIVLDLPCCSNGNGLEARATPVDDRRPGIMMWPNPGVVPPPTLAVPLGCIIALGRGLVHINGCICLGICHAYVYGESQVP